MKIDGKKYLNLKAGTVFLAVFLVFFLSVGTGAPEFPGTEILHAKPTPASTHARAAKRMEERRRQAEDEDRNIKLFITLGVLSLFGACCAIVAQRSFRNVFLWFVLGFLFNVIALLFILRIYHRRKKHFRRRTFLYAKPS